MKETQNPPSQAAPGRRQLLLLITAVSLTLLSLAAAVACPAEAQESAPGNSIRGVVTDATSLAPLADAEVVIVGANRAVRTDSEGRFVVAPLPAGTYTLEARLAGYLPRTLSVVVTDGGEPGNLAFRLDPLARFVDTVVVTPSQYTLYQELPETRASLSREEIEKMPHFADDVFRAIRWLPGTSGEDLSAETNVRGGSVDESLVLLDGLELEEGYHLKEMFSMVSILDAEVIDRLEFMSGGFPVEYGNRMSGVVDITSASPTATRTSLGLSTTNLSLLTEGSFAAGRGQWLLSARRTDLDLMIEWVDPENGLEPNFSDFFAKVAYQLGSSTILSAEVLRAQDTTHYEDAADDRGVDELLDSSSTIQYGWVNVRTAWSPRLYSQTVLSSGRVERDREGWIDYWYQKGTVDDERWFDVIGLRQDWSLDLSSRHALKWGFDARAMDATYDYTSHGVVQDPLFLDQGETSVIDREISLEPEGSAYTAYVADRFRLWEPLLVEVGVRWDHQTVNDESQVSPRVNLVGTLGPHTTLRASWGLYHQAQRLNELQVPDGVTTFYPAQQAEHRLLALEHGFPSGLDLRVEAYQKKLSDVMPHYENLLNPIEILPELESDRILVAPDRSEAKGVEVVLRRDGGKRWSWWLSYAWARVEDEIDGEWVPRSWDQPQTATFSLNYRPSARWNFNLSGVYHTGWPTTAVYGELITDEEGGVWVQPYTGPRNRERLDHYLRFDVRASRDFHLRDGLLSVYLEVTNLLNRENLARPESFSWWMNSGGDLVLEINNEAFMPMIPSLGLRWTF